jgi:amidophosphoribosyltransferase
MDFPQKSELIAAKQSVPEICSFLECDSLAYLSMEGLFKAVSHDDGGYCTACFDGVYPIPIEEKFNKHQHDIG